MEEDMGKVPDKILAREIVLTPEEAKKLDGLYNKMMDSKILFELNDLKDKCNNIKTILSKDITSIAKQIHEKVDLPTYKYTEEESQVVQEIEEIMEYINKAIGKFYKYEDDIEKNNNDDIKGE